MSILIELPDHNSINNINMININNCKSSTNINDKLNIHKNDEILSPLSDISNSSSLPQENMDIITSSSPYIIDNNNLSFKHNIYPSINNLNNKNLSLKELKRKSVIYNDNNIVIDEANELISKRSKHSELDNDHSSDGLELESCNNSYMSINALSNNRISDNYDICGPMTWPKYELTNTDVNNLYHPSDAPEFFNCWNQFTLPSLYETLYPDLLLFSFSDSVLHTMFEREKNYQPNPNYLEYQLITPDTRAVLFDWMMEVSQEFSLCRETLYLGANFIDRFLSKHPKFPKANLQLVGVTSLWMAAKIEELISPKASDFVLTTANAYTVEQMIEMETFLLTSLDWHLQHITPHSFVTIFIKRLTYHLLKLLEQQCVSSALDSLKAWAQATVSTSETGFDISINWLSKNLNVIPSVVGNDSEVTPLLSLDFHSTVSITNKDESQSAEKNFNLTHSLPPILLNLLNSSIFYRIMELLDVALLDISFLKFYPSALAVSSLCVICPAVAEYISLICPYTLLQLQPCVVWLSSFSMLPHRGLLLPKKPYFDVKTASDEYYTKQLHHPLALKFAGFK